MTDLFHTDWDTVDLKALRDEENARLLASGTVTKAWLDKYGDASFDAALAVLGILGPNETVDSVTAEKGNAKAEADKNPENEGVQ